MDFEEYLRLCAAKNIENPELRHGHILWEVLWTGNPALAVELERGGNLDVSRSDFALIQFLHYVCRHWNDYQ